MEKELLIFGANGALGRGVTETLIKKDYDKVYLFDFRFDEQFQNNPKVEKIVIDDLAVESNVETAFKNITPSKGKLFFLLSTVGGFFGGKYLWETGTDEFEKMLGINLRSNFLIAKQFAKLVKDSKGGSILFTAALTGINAETKKGSYGISKSGLIHLVENLALEGKEIKLTVNALAPYIIDTPSNREWMKEADYDSWQKPPEVGELAHNLFCNFYFINGNIIKLTERISI